MKQLPVVKMALYLSSPNLHSFFFFQIVYSKLTDLLPSAITSEDDPDLQRPSLEEIEDTTEKTRQALEKLTQVSSCLSWSFVRA